MTGRRPKSDKNDYVGQMIAGNKFGYTFSLNLSKSPEETNRYINPMRYRTEDTLRKKWRLSIARMRGERGGYKYMPMKI